MKKQYMVLLVENNAGVLTRVCSMFMQRGFNIDSLTVSSTDNPAISRITVCTTGDNRTFSQIMRQTGKLIETKMIFSVEPSFSLIRELLLIKFASDGNNKEKLAYIFSKYGANVIDTSEGCIVAQLTENPSKIDDFLDDVKEFNIIEMCRSGATALEKGNVLYEFD